MRKQYSRYGLWHVTTEGDVEGRSTRDLGTHRGNFDEIAAALADKACYSLCFALVEPLNQKVDVNLMKEVSVHFDIDSGTWNMPKDKREDFFRSLLPHDGPVVVKDSNYHACVKLAPRVPPTSEELAKHNLIKKLALSKEQLQTLGVDVCS